MGLITKKRRGKLGSFRKLRGGVYNKFKETVEGVLCVKSMHL